MSLNTSLQKIQNLMKNRKSKQSSKDGYSQSLKQRLCEASSLYANIKKRKQTSYFDD